MTTTVNVACKLPNGLAVDHDGKTFTLRGANHPAARFGYGVTAVDADLFKGWSETHKDFAPLKADLIFLAGRDAAGATKERAKDKRVRTGAEPIDPTKPGAGVEPTEEQAKELAKLPSDPSDPTAS